MSKVICEKEDIVAIADATRATLGTSDEMTLGEIAYNINGINDIYDEINQLKESIDDLVVTGGGISTTAKNLLITILRNALYNTNQSDNITELESALGSFEPDEPVEPDEPDTPVEPDEPEKIYYTITNSLTNVSNSNSVSSILENSSYSATLSANDGYTIETVSITMGGIDVTSSVYDNGIITISKVTGNIVINANAIEEVVTEAELITNGLLGYFDFRTTEYNNNYGTGLTAIKPTQGSGQLFTWAKDSIALQDEKGIHTANTRAYMYDKNGATSQTDLGTEYTFVMLSYGHVSVFDMNYMNVLPLWGFRPKYKNTSSSEVVLEVEGGDKFNNDSCTDYNFCVTRVNGSDLTMIMDTSRKDYDGTSISDFSSWVSKPLVGLANLQDRDGKYLTACAFYDRALSDVEIEELRAFFKTLEVA